MISNETHEPPLQKEDYETLAAFRYALRQFLRFSEEAASAAGVSPQQHQALLVIKGFPGRDYVTVGELAERLQVRPHSAVGLVDRLAADGLVLREQDRHGIADRRKVSVALTPGGSAMLEKLSAVHREELRRTGPKLHLLLQSLTASRS